MLTVQTKHERVELPAGFTTRPATIYDAQIVTNLLNAESLEALGVTQFSYDECMQSWSEPGFDIENSSLMVFAPDGWLAGFIEIWDHEAIPTKIHLFGATHPDYYGLGIGSYMLQWATDTAVRALPRVPEDLQVVTLTTAYGDHQPSCELMRDYAPQTRVFFRMGIDLDRPIPEPRLAEGLEIVTFAQFDDVLAVYRAYNESFKDHWGHIDQPEEEGLARFKHHFEDPSFDPTLWFMVKDGAEIAAVSLCFSKSDEDPTVGHVKLLGVRRPWRRMGLGLALLHHTFREFQARGFRGVALGVDAQSPTGATQLYERAGMRVKRSTNVYEKVLRVGREG